MIMKLPLIGHVASKSFAAGAVLTSVAWAFGRPLVVGAVRAGYAIRDEAAEALSEARASAQNIRSEALARREAGAEAEVARLRQEIAALKAAKKAS